MRKFAKLDLSIIDSSIWFQPDHVFRVWMVMICKRNYRTGIVSNTVLGLARDAIRTVEETRDALRVLHEPDPESRTKDHDGRRIETVEGGWRLLNHDTYNEMMSAEEERARKRKWAADNRAGKKVAVSSERVDETERETSTSSDVDPRSDLSSTIYDLDSDPEGSEEGVTRVNPLKGRFVPVGFEPTDAHRVRCQELKIDIEALLLAFMAQEFNRDYSDWPRRFSKWIEDERIKREAAAFKASQAPSGRGFSRGGPAWEPSSQASAYAAKHGLVLASALPAYRREYQPDEKYGPDVDSDFQRRLVCWVETGTFIPKGPLPKRVKPSPPANETGKADGT